MQGTLVKYGPNPSHLAFISPPDTWQATITTPTSPAPANSSAACAAAPHAVLVGGLTDGLLFASYIPPLAEALTARGWHVVQAQISSSYTGWGCGSLDRDADELLLLCRWLVQHRSASTLLLLGHSTGCNDIVRLMQKAGAQGLLPATNGDAPSEGQVPIVGTILQAPVSDTEMFNQEGAFPGLSALASQARALVAAGAGEQVVHRFEEEGWCGAPVTASRLVSLHSPQGDDDMFSSALTDTQLKAILGPVGARPCLVVASGADQYVPERLLAQIPQQAARLAAAISSGGHVAQVEVVQGGDHVLTGQAGALTAHVVGFCNALLAAAAGGDAAAAAAAAAAGGGTAGAAAAAAAEPAAEPAATAAAPAASAALAAAGWDAAGVAGGGGGVLRACSAPPGLLDMPAPWLDALVDEVFCDCRPSLFAASRALRDLVAARRQLKIHINLPVPPDQAAAVQARLLLACKLSNNVKLWLTELYAKPQDTLVAASSLMFGAMAAVGRGLDAITSVDLSGLDLALLVPCWVAFTCPRMISLELSSCVLTTLATPSASLPACGQLRELRLQPPPGRIDGPNSRWINQHPTHLPRWQHQLRSLTGLTSLHAEGPQFPPWFIEACSTVGAHLTALSLSNVPTAHLPQLPAWFPCLTDLQLPDTEIDDQGMEAVFSMQLQRFTCSGFQLQHSYNHRPCTWQHLEFHYLDIPSFDRLPLEGVRSMVGWLRVVPSSGGDLGAASRVAAALARCGGCTWQLHTLVLDNSRNHADVAAQEAAMTIVGSCRYVQFKVYRVSPVTAELLAAISLHLPRPPPIPGRVHAAIVQFHSCTFSPEVWPLLLPSLPPMTSRFILGPQNPVEVTEAQVTTMCVYACRPVEVMVHPVIIIRGGWEEGWEQRVRAAMAAAGHQHVQFYEAESDCETDSDDEPSSGDADDPFFMEDGLGGFSSEDDE